jgi:hypothetical protein
MSEQLPPVEPPVEPPASPTTAAEPARQHPISLVVTDDVRRSRLTVFFRLLLILPHVVWIALWGIAAFLLLVVAWFVGIVMGRLPHGLHRFFAAFVRYGVHLRAYYWIAANPFPGFLGAPGYAVDVIVAPAARQSRLMIFFRGLFIIPTFVVLYQLQLVGTLLAVIIWFYALVTGRTNEGMRDLQLHCLRYEAQTLGYLFLLTQRYPGFSRS